MSAEEIIAAHQEISSSAMWITIYMYKLYSICYCIQSTGDEVCESRTFLCAQLLPSWFYFKCSLYRREKLDTICINLACIRTIRARNLRWNFFLLLAVAERTKVFENIFPTLVLFIRSKCFSCNFYNNGLNWLHMDFSTLIWGYSAWWDGKQNFATFVNFLYCRLQEPFWHTFSYLFNLISLRSRKALQARMAEPFRLKSLKQLGTGSRELELLMKVKQSPLLILSASLAFHHIFLIKNSSDEEHFRCKTYKSF